MQETPRLPFDEGDDSVNARIDARDRAARAHAVDPRFNVALEASAGTGKTRVLVDRYLNLLKAGVDPVHILAVTFTRKAATEMRERILSALRLAAERGEILPSRWRELRDRTGDIAVSTIDAFCLSLLREFPLEADLDPGFSMAEDTEVPRLIDESLDRALRTCRSIARDDENVALVFAQLGDRRVKAGLAALLSRRLVAPEVLRRYLGQGPPEWTVEIVAARGATALRDVFAGMRGGLDAFLGSGPNIPAFRLLARALRALGGESGGSAAAAVHAAFVRARGYFLTQDGTPRKRVVGKKADFRTGADYERHRDLVIGHAPSIVTAYASYRRDLNVLVARGVWRMFAVAEKHYRATLDAHAVLDFPDVLQYTLRLLGQMEEFSQSRYRLESRYHHVLVDEFQDTSRAQWELVSLLVRAWGEGAGLAHQGPVEPSVFIVGDRKQSIYGFRDADVAVLGEAGRAIARLRPGGDVRRSISRSFRSVPALLAFVNDVCADLDKLPDRTDAFAYGEDDVFPLDDARGEPLDESGAVPATVLGLVPGAEVEACAAATAAEIAALVNGGVTVRDRETGVPRPVRPGDVAILFRTRESHREFEDALARAGLPSYVYKGLGFFDSDEIKDLLALLWYLAEPSSDLRAAAFLRSRLVRLSDEGLRRLAPGLAGALIDAGRSEDRPLHPQPLDEVDAARLEAVRAAAARWRRLADRLPPAELIDLALHESAYGVELRGPRFQQARENVKKFRTLLRRIQNRGYATLGRIASHLDRLAVGDESNASLDATNAVNLMTVHAAKGLEFPVVFLVNLARGTGNRADHIRIGTEPVSGAASVSIGDFVSEYDEDRQAREREETKRLLYVAVTRARDRLYLSSVLKDGRIAPGRGSLAEVLPGPLLECFAAAAAGTPVEWRASSGRTHVFRVSGTASEVADAPPPTTEPGPAMAPDDLLPVTAVVTTRPATSDPGSSIAAGQPDAGGESDRTLGTVVHRMLQAMGAAGDHDAGAVPAMALRLLRPDEAVALDDREAFALRAAAAYQALCRHPEVRRFYAAGDVLHEVPFALDEGGVVVRGTIDCLIRVAPDEVAVLEFKTGRARPEHAQQLALYGRVAGLLFPGARVVEKLIYTESGLSP